MDSPSSFDLSGAITSASVPDVIQAPCLAANIPGRGQSGVSSIYSDAYTNVVTPSWTVSAGTLTNEVIVTDSGDTSKKVTGADSVTITRPHARCFGDERAACECLALEAER